MHAAVLREIGGTLEFAEVADPVPQGDEVLVDITHASVNPLDIWITRGAPGAAAANLPWIPGSEAVGLLDGRQVLVRGAGLGIIRPGLFATKAAVPRDAIAELPEGTDPAAAAAIGVAAVTAWGCVHTLGQCSAGDRVLVLGASGGVGSLSVQLARATGATVWGQTTSADKAAGITALGAQQVVVADDSQLVAAVAELQPTLVIDGLGGRFTTASVEALQARGRLVLYGASASDDIPLSSRTFYRKGLTLLGYTGLLATAEEQEEVFPRLLEMVRTGELVVPTELVPLSQAADAFARILDRKVEGKLVLDTSR